MLVRTCGNRVNGLVKKCSACGAENRHESNYCLKCGESVVIRPGQVVPIATETATTTPVQPFEWPTACIFHPHLPSQFSCVMCGLPICLICARFDYRNVYCPICYARRSPPSRPGIQFYPGPMFPYPRYESGRRILG